MNNKIVSKCTKIGRIIIRLCDIYVSVWIPSIGSVLALAQLELSLANCIKPAVLGDELHVEGPGDIESFGNLVHLSNRTRW